MDLPPPPPTEHHESIDQYAFIKEPDLGQYKGSDYANALRVERGITLEKACEIANSDANIDYFMHVKGHQMVFEIPPNVDFDPECDPLGLVTETTYQTDEGRVETDFARIFHHGDVVFFGYEGKWLGTASGLSDIYSKRAYSIDW